MAETWPVSLQQILNEADFSYAIGDTTIRSDMDIGPAKVRRRSTRGVDTLSCSINLTTAQYSTFYYFYDTSLNGGVKTFNFVHPITGATNEFRFVAPPAFRYLGASNWAATMSWEKLP